MYHGFYTLRGRKFPHGNFRTSVFCEVKTQIVGKTKFFDRLKPPRRAVFDLLTILPRDTFQLPRGSAHKIAFALQTHKNWGRGPGHLLLPLRGNSPCVPRFLYFKREKVSERELSDVRVLRREPPSEHTCRRNEVSRQVRTRSWSLRARCSVRTRRSSGLLRSGRSLQCSSEPCGSTSRRRGKPRLRAAVPLRRTRNP